MRRVALVLSVLTLVASGCAKSYSGSGATGIEGAVVIGPTCPVERPDSLCPPAPFAAKITVLRDGNEVTTYKTGSDGRFRIPLEPGTYTVRAESLQPAGIARFAPLRPVTVPADGYTSVTITFDSGIR